MLLQLLRPTLAIACSPLDAGQTDVMMIDMHDTQIVDFQGLKTPAPEHKLKKDNLNCESVALPVARRTNNRKVLGSMPANVVCITVLTGNRQG